MEIKYMNPNTNNLLILKELVRLSQLKRLIFSKDEEDIYHASLNHLSVSIEMYNFQRMDEQSSDDTTAVLSIQVDNQGNLNHLILDFSIGCEGFDLIIKILASSFSEWEETWNRVERKKLVLISYLNQL